MLRRVADMTVADRLECHPAVDVDPMMRQTGQCGAHDGTPLRCGIRECPPDMTARVHLRVKIDFQFEPQPTGTHSHGPVTRSESSRRDPKGSDPTEVANRIWRESATTGWHAWHVARSFSSASRGFGAVVLVEDDEHVESLSHAATTDVQQGSWRLCVAQSATHHTEIGNSPAHAAGLRFPQQSPGRSNHGR